MLNEEIADTISTLEGLADGEDDDLGEACMGIVDLLKRLRDKIVFNSNEKYVVVLGSPFADGLSIHGMFIDSEDAFEWANEHKDHFLEARVVRISGKEGCERIPSEMFRSMESFKRTQIIVDFGNKDKAMGWFLNNGYRIVDHGLLNPHDVGNHPGPYKIVAEWR